MQPQTALLRVSRCGLSPQVLGDALSEALVALPAEVKVVGSGTDNMVPLEELTLRTLHRTYHHRLTGEPQSVSYVAFNAPCVTFPYANVYRSQPSASHHPTQEPTGPTAVSSWPLSSL